MLIGKKLSGRYKLMEVIGGGGMANVYLAKDIILERDVAIKILRFDFSNDEEFIKRFHREAFSATSLNHPNIVNIYDVGEEDNIYYIVMEYVPGQTLKQYIQKFAPIPVEKALPIMEQLTSAIAHAHQNQIIHRDIKPQNILIDHFGNVKITDFGIAMALSSTTITHTNSVLGSVHYLSPEQARGGMATKKSDIYSLGIVMFEILTGRLPFSGESAVSIALKHLQTNTPSPKKWNPDLPQSIENIILKSTAKDPFYRYQSAEEMEDDIRTSLDPERLNESLFSIPQVDDEITKAIPIIGQNEFIKQTEKTIIRNTDGKKDSDDSKNKDKITKKKKRGNKLAISLVTIFILLVGAGIAAVTLFPSIFTPKDVIVPDVSNKPYEEAVEELIDKGFEVADPIEIPDENIPEDYVVKTNPEAGEEVKKSSSVTIYKSTGKEQIAFGDYVGKNFDSVKNYLSDQNYIIKPPIQVYDSKAIGEIIEQDPEPEALVIPEETEVTFTISKGPEKIILKDLTKFSLESVNDYIDEQGLNLDVKEEFSDEIDEGLVIRQDPKPKTELEEGDTLTVYISKGKEEIPPKQVSRAIDIPYQPNVEGQEVEVKIYIEDATHTGDNPEQFTIKEPTKMVLRLTIPYGKSAFYKVVVDGNVIETDLISYPE